MKKGRLDWEVFCSKCSSTISVAHGGKSDINDHLKSAKHKRADNAAASSMSATRFSARRHWVTLNKNWQRQKDCGLTTQ